MVHKKRWIDQSTFLAFLIVSEVLSAVDVALFLRAVKCIATTVSAITLNILAITIGVHEEVDTHTLVSGIGSALTIVSINNPASLSVVTDRTVHVVAAIIAVIAVGIRNNGTGALLDTLIITIVAVGCRT